MWPYSELLIIIREGQQGAALRVEILWDHDKIEQHLSLPHVLLFIPNPASVFLKSELS